ncbi:hypothetical protein F5X68DRAFT_201251, partial [Plectosphaerella plurivora]
MTGIRGRRWAYLLTASPVRCSGLPVPASRVGRGVVCWEQRGGDARHIDPPTAPLCKSALLGESSLLHWEACCIMYPSTPSRLV